MHNIHFNSYICIMLNMVFVFLWNCWFSKKKKERNCWLSSFLLSQHIYWKICFFLYWLLFDMSMWLVTWVTGCATFFHNFFLFFNWWYGKCTLATTSIVMCTLKCRMWIYMYIYVKERQILQYLFLPNNNDNDEFFLKKTRLYWVF